MSEHITFELTRGYLDSEGKRHRKVVLRAPCADDEIKADRAVNLLKNSRDANERAEGYSDTLWGLALLEHITLQLGELRQVTTAHLRTLSRKDVALMQAKMAELERILEGGEEPDPNPGSSASTSSDSLAPPPSPSANS